MDYGIGIDIGGTKISMVLGTSRGKILAESQIPTLHHAQIKLCARNLVASLHGLIADSGIPRRKICGIGIGIPGVVNNQKGVMPDSPNLHSWKGFPLRKILVREFHIPVTMINDANAAVMAEKIFGQGRGWNHVVYITVSTGIGSGMIANGRLVQGAAFGAGELGHMTLVPFGEPCNCGKYGCLEAYASGTAIARFVEAEIRKGRSRGIEKLIGKKKGITGFDVGIAAKARHALALNAYRRAGFYLGVGLGNLLNILNPQIVILGGGVWNSAPKDLWRSMMVSCKREAWVEAFRSVRIVKTKLGERVGNLGALSLVFAQDQLGLASSK
ncbi:MAG: ROK family protein [Candidatus Omnitrophica bacterium]|nr:ROK family protein [Candidatus Omnitrophota bacterium]